MKKNQLTNYLLRASTRTARKQLLSANVILKTKDFKNYFGMQKKRELVKK
ncbi:hypothetical protein GCM10023116_19380 [Kistimonas scapharcae]|uniref:Ribosomal protein L32 n=1 Tax=Kistimonas scapharcae TaxID=1036133 RepID=A0ABP8V2Y0_9GAMM